MRKIKMIRSVFFALLLLLAITPLTVVAADHATVTAANTPTCMTPGETKAVSATVLNDGDATWTAGTYKVSYHWEGPMSIWDGMRTDLDETMKSQVVSAQLKAGNHQTGENLPVGAYTLKWQVIHTGTGWIPAETSYAVEVKASCSTGGGIGSLGQLCKIIDCWGTPINTNPFISSLMEPPFRQEQKIVIRGNNFGDTPGSVTMTGFFGTASGTPTSFQMLAKHPVTLPVIADSWSSKLIVTGPIPANLMGLDQEVEIQVKSKDGKLSNIKKTAFETLREIKMLPRSAMTSQLAVTNTNPDVETASSDPAQPQSLWVTHEATSTPELNCNGAQIKEDKWTAKLHPHQSYYGYLFSHWAGNFPQAPAVTVNNNNLTFPVKWAFEHTDTKNYPAARIELWFCHANYLANIYYSTPKGMD